MEGGWLGHYKSHDIFPITPNEYAWVNSYEGFPHLQIINWNSLAVDWRTDGEYEVNALNHLTTFFLFYSYRLKKSLFI